MSGKKKVLSFRGNYREYLEGKVKLSVGQKVGILMLVWVIAGVVGWIYEFLVALFETGEVYMQGGNLLPWINIYAIGAVLVVPATMKIRKWPWLVFLVSAGVTGAVELIGGWLVYVIGDGTRYWNYDHGAWLFGNINGFVCVLSVTFFAMFAMMLVYLILPGCVYLARKWKFRVFMAVAALLFSVVMVDEVVNLTLKNLGKPTAMDFYRGLGAEYQEF